MVIKLLSKIYLLMLNKKKQKTTNQNAVSKQYSVRIRSFWSKSINKNLYMILILENFMTLKASST